MSGRRFALIAALALFVIFIAGNLIANTWFRTWRLDLTENQLYSLSDGTERTLDALTEPVELRFYFSRDAASSFPSVQTYGARVREMLQTFQARSNGRVRFVEINVEPFSEEEDQAVEAGIEPRQVMEGADPIYMGLAGANAIDDQVPIPFLDPSREAFLEYEITRLIYELESPDLPRIGLITSLPMNPGDESAAMFGQRQSMFETELGRTMNVEKLDIGFTAIPEGIDVLAIIHPGPLSPPQLYAIDQFILRHGRAFIALDPASMQAQRNAGGMDPFSMMGGAPSSSNLDPLLERWGVAMTREVVLDLDGALEVQTQDPQSGQPVNAPQPLFFRVPPAQRDAEDMLMAWFSRDMNFGLAGALTWSEREGVTITPLASTSGRTRRIAAERALMQPSPFELLMDWPPGGRIETIALRLSGNLETAYPNGAPAPEPVELAEGVPPPAAPPAPTGEALTRSATPAELVIVSDADFLDDAFYVDGGGIPRSDNGAFALNALDILSGSDALVSLRARAPSERRMEMVDAMERDARRRIQSREEELESEYAETQQRLAQLRAGGRGSGFFAGDLGAELTTEERAEIDRLERQIVQVRTEQRAVGRELLGDIDRLEALIVFINVWLAPLLIACVGLYLFWRRQRRARRAQR